MLERSIISATAEDTPQAAPKRQRHSALVMTMGYALLEMLCKYWDNSKKDAMQRFDFFKSNNCQEKKGASSMTGTTVHA
jgi:hypothetical protein